MTETTNQPNDRISAVVAAIAAVLLLVLLGSFALAVYDLNTEFLSGVGTTLGAVIAFWILYDYRHGTSR